MSYLDPHTSLPVYVHVVSASDDSEKYFYLGDPPLKTKQLYWAIDVNIGNHLSRI